MGKDKNRLRKKRITNTNEHKENIFLEKIFQNILKYFRAIIILSMIVSLFIEVIEGRWSKQDYDLEQARNIEIELVPHFETDLSYEDIIRDKGFRLYYDIYFINNNMNDISVSDIVYIMGNSYESMENPSEMDSEFKEAMTLAAGSNFYVRESIWCEVPYEYLKQMIPTDDDVRYISVIDQFLKDKFHWKEEQDIIYNTDGVDQRGVAVYYTTDYDGVRHATRFNVSYMGIDKEDIFRNMLSIEDGFAMDKQSYER